MHIVCPPAQIVHPQVDDASLDRLAGQRLPQRVQIAGEDGHHIDTHRSVQLQETLGRVDLDGLILQRHRGDDGADERHQHLTVLTTH